MIGKIIGFVFGVYAGGFFLGLVGLFIGHLFDRGYARQQAPVSSEELHRIQAAFFNTLFLLAGHLAKADGRISETEINLTEGLMDQMGLTAEHRREAIRLFKSGAESDFNPDSALQEFRRLSARSPNLLRMLLVYLINLAMADGTVDEVEAQVLRRVAEQLGFSGFAFEQLLRMIQAQNAFAGSSGGSYRSTQASPRADELALAYQALGVTASASDAEVKRAYRKLMSEYHPDKLMGQGLPEDMIKAATERSQEIQTAYDIVKKSRRQ
jgi:DnaJ like chaperone protein